VGNADESITKIKTDTKKIIPSETQKEIIKVTPTIKEVIIPIATEKDTYKPTKQKIEESKKSNCDPNYS
jgi:hypothetical protein